MGETDLQLGGGYRYQWESAILLALNYFFDPLRYNPTLFDLIQDFLGQVTAIGLEGEDRERDVELEDVNLIGGDRRILIQVKTKQAEGERWTLSDPLLRKALYRFYDSEFLTEHPDTTRFVFLTNRPFSPNLIKIRSAVRRGMLDQCPEVDKLRQQLDRYAQEEKKEPIDPDRFRQMLVRTALVAYLPVDSVKASVQLQLQAHWQKDRNQAFALLYEHFSRQSTLKGGGKVTRESIIELLGPPLEVRREPVRLCHNLPPRCRYVERDSYVDQLLEELSVAQETEWVIGICGPTGAGKTMLALEVAHCCLKQETFEGIVWMTAEQQVLTTAGTVKGKSVLTSFEDLCDDIAETLGCENILKMGSLEEKQGAVRQVLKTRRCLLIVDSIASLGGVETVNDLRDFAQPTKIVVTSRLRLAGLDCVHYLEGMDLPPALELMRTECEAKGVAASDRDLMTLYERTGGIPVAMVWCIGGMTKRPVSRVLHRMQNVEGDLLQYCYARAEEELTLDAKRLLRIMALFATSASYDAVYAISGIADEDSVDEAIGQSVDLSLSRYQDGRYSLLRLTRTFVLAELEQREPDEVIRLKRAYANYFLTYAEAHSSRSAGDLEVLGIEHKNIREAVGWCAGQGDEDVQTMLPRFALALYDFQWLGGYWNELVEYNRLAFEVCKRRGEWREAGDHAYAIGFVRFQQGNLDEAGEWGQEAVSAMAQQSNEFHQARVKRLPAMVARERDDHGTSRRLLDEMLASGEKLLKAAKSDAEIRAIKDDLLADGLTSLGNLERDVAKNHPEARRLYEEALAINRELGNTEQIGLTLNHLGRVDLAEYEQARCEGRDDEATRHLELAEIHFTEGRQASEDAPRADQILIAMWGQARVAEEKGEYARARELAQEAMGCYGFCGAAEVAEVQELLDRTECALEE